MRAAVMSFILLIVVSESVCDIQVKGFVGGALLIKCKFDEKYKDKNKFFCKSRDNRCPFESQAKDSRYKEFHERAERLYVVFIKQLALTDTGDYRCVLDNDENKYTEVTINIRPDDCCTQTLTVNSHVGGHADIPCKYPSESKDNRKFFCRQRNVFTCGNLISASSRRFSVADDKAQSIFTVRISNVSSSRDSGVYWCGVRTGGNTDSVTLLTEVTLKVQDPERPTQPPSLPPAVSPLIIGVCLTLAVLMFIIVFMYLRRRHNRTSNPTPPSGDLITRTPRDKEQTCADREINDPDRPPPRPLTERRSPVSNTREEGHPADIIDPSDPTDLSDGPSYATVHFHRNPEQRSRDSTGDAQQAEDSSCEYATVKH
ncbi:polymeric immunoglobulin receptor-like isoform X1 [Alosa sapidissima]|uniref:polymeric immunoglobulin receptor-like isoform X1 n=1 Tax=Alosa sapidissima TaxID=34773 RepID=UPI001C09D691|nr:polymeric immunoglobulin receptor-like isoform X1 [Alosa sapidissima]